jgi:ABC-2 type transport system permease protein
VKIAGSIRRIENVLIPPVISLDVRTSESQSTTSLSFGQLFLPGLLFMSILFIVQGVSVDVWEEKTRGTLRRVLTAPQPAGSVLGGKLAAGMLLIAVVSTVALVMAVALFGIAWWRVPAALAWCAYAGGALLALMTLLQLAAASERGAHLISTMAVLPLMMLGGSFFPFEAMPDWMAAIGQLTPNGLAVVRLKDLLYGDPALAPMVIAAAGIGIPAVAAFALSVKRLTGRFATS